MTPYPESARSPPTLPPRSPPQILSRKSALSHLPLRKNSLSSSTCRCRRHPPSPAMAAVASTSAAASPCLLQRPLATPNSLRAAARPVVGLPALRMPRVVCSAEKKEKAVNEKVIAAATSAATMVYAHPVLALVDERLSGEGTGLGLGVSNPQLIWILVGVIALIWALYFTYSSTLPEGDDDSGLDL